MAAHTYLAFPQRQHFEGHGGLAGGGCKWWRCCQVVGGAGVGARCARRCEAPVRTRATDAPCGAHCRYERAGRTFAVATRARACACSGPRRMCGGHGAGSHRAAPGSRRLRPVAQPATHGAGTGITRQSLRCLEQGKTLQVEVCCNFTCLVGHLQRRWLRAAPAHLTSRHRANVYGAAREFRRVPKKYAASTHAIAPTGDIQRRALLEQCAGSWFWGICTCKSGRRSSDQGPR